MSDVVLENTIDIKCSLKKKQRFIKFILFWEFIYFFPLLNYPIVATEVCFEKSFLEYAQSHE